MFIMIIIAPLRLRPLMRFVLFLWCRGLPNDSDMSGSDDDEDEDEDDDDKASPSSGKGKGSLSSAKGEGSPSSTDTPEPTTPPEVRKKYGSYYSDKRGFPVFWSWGWFPV
jgi:hypothetical protein